MARTAPVSRTIAALGGTVDEALGDVQVPAYVVSSDGTVRWLNTRALAVLGDVRGQPFASAAMPDSLHAARVAFARKIAGTKRATDYDVTLRSAAGEPVSAQVSSVAIRGDHRVVGIFGLIHINEMPDPTRPVRHPHLTPRQQEVLGYLAQGCSTDQIAARLVIERETV